MTHRQSERGRERVWGRGQQQMAVRQIDERGVERVGGLTDGPGMNERAVKGL